jgi:hypothetical protein
VHWVRLATAFPRNPKVLDVLAEKDGHRTIVAYLFGLAYAGDMETDGFIPAESLGTFGARQADADRLVAAGLWQAERGGWSVHDWRDYQLSTHEMRARSERAREAALTRWKRGRGEVPRGGRKHA